MLVNTSMLFGRFRSDEDFFSSHLFILAPLRALYLGDNEFEVLPPEIKNLVNLQVVIKIFFVISGNVTIKTKLALEIITATFVG